MIKLLPRKILIIFALFINYAFAAPSAPLFDNLGHHHHAITTTSELAQRYFDQGLTLDYSFEYAEAIRSFRAAVQQDPKCAMCYWGLALALGSKTDAPMDGKELAEAKSALQTASALVDPRKTAERIYIAALARRYSALSSEKLKAADGLCSSYSLVSGNDAKDYADEMRKLVNLYPDDLDAKVLYVGALFDLTEWDFWTHAGKPKPYSTEILHQLDTVLAADPNHPGANHLFIHFIQMSPEPERGLPSAQRLSSLVPGAEHMVHMPCHIYFTVGRYHEATLANQQAIAAFKNYIQQAKAQGFAYEPQYLYYHNIAFLAAAASMEGRKQLAIASGQTLATEVAPLVEKNHFFQKWSDDYVLMLARFGEWQKILNLPAPPADYQYSLGIWHYAHGLAAIQSNQLDVAKQDLNQLQQFTKQGAVDNNLGKMGYGVLKIANEILAGLIDHQSNHNDSMLDHFKVAVQLQDDSNSNDPPPWYFPTRQLLGTALFKLGRFAEAKTVFEQDLKLNPNNGWSLFGLMQCERALGNDVAAQQVEQLFKIAWQYADIKTPVYPI